MEWVKKHIDLIVMLSAFASSMLWMNGKFNDIEKDITTMKTAIHLKQRSSK